MSEPRLVHLQLTGILGLSHGPATKRWRIESNGVALWARENFHEYVIAIFVPATHFHRTASGAVMFGIIRFPALCSVNACESTVTNPVERLVACRS